MTVKRIPHSESVGTGSGVGLEVIVGAAVGVGGTWVEVDVGNTWVEVGVGSTGVEVDVAERFVELAYHGRCVRAF